MNQIKTKKTDFEKVKEFWKADPHTFFGEDWIAPVRSVGVATLQNERWYGKGIPFRKISGRVLYRKIDVISWLESYPLVNSTSEYKREE